METKKCKHCGTTEDLVISTTMNQYMDKPIITIKNICNSCRNEISRKANIGKVMSEEAKQKHREATKKLFKDPEYVKKHREGMKKKYFIDMKEKKWKLDKMVENYLSGMTLKDSVKEFRCSPKICSIELKKRGVAIRPLSYYLSPSQEKKDIMIENYLNGMCAETAGKSVGFSGSVCFKVLKEKGIKSRTIGEHRSPSKEQQNLMVKNYLDGMGSIEAGASVGYSATTCLKELKKRSIPIKINNGTRFSVNDNYFEKIDTEDKAYWLGFIVADGCITTRNRILITLHEKDKGHLEKFLKNIEYKGKIKTLFANKKNKEYYKDINKEYKYNSISITSKKLYSDIQKYGVTLRKSLTIKPYKNFKNKKLEASYWRGIIDGDGCLCKHKNKTSKKNYTCQIALTGNKFIIAGFIDFLQRNNIETTSKIQNKKNIRQIQYRKKESVLLISNLLYKDASIYLDRKYEKYLEFKNFI